MRPWWKNNWFPVALPTLLIVGMLAIGFKNGWS